MFGFSDHDLMFSKEAKATVGGEAELGAGQIQAQVARAQALVALESEENRVMAEQGQYKSAEVFREARGVSGTRNPSVPSSIFASMFPPAETQSQTPDADSQDSDADSDVVLSQTMRSIIITEDEVLLSPILSAYSLLIHVLPFKFGQCWILK
jgi:hypothetical protein